MQFINSYEETDQSTFAPTMTVQVHHLQKLYPEAPCPRSSTQSCPQSLLKLRLILSESMS